MPNFEFRSSYVQRSDRIEAGQQSNYYSRLSELDTQNILTEEQLAIMSLICDKVKYGLDLESFVYEVISAQNLMPANGKIISRQILCLIARTVGME